MGTKTRTETSIMPSASLFIVVWLAAVTVFARQTVGLQAEYSVSSSVELLSALTDSTGPSTVLLSDDYILIKEEDFHGFQLPLVVLCNKTIQGRSDRWATLSTSRLKSKLRLGNGVTLTLRWVLLSDMLDDISSGANAGIVPMAPGETGIMLYQHVAYSVRWCYPPSLITQFLGLSTRPKSFPGENVYSATAVIPAALRSMGGGLGGSSATDAENTSCTNSTLAPLLRQCWGHVAQCEDFAIEGSLFDEKRTLTKLGYYIHFQDVYLLCQDLLTMDCINNFTAYGCLQTHKMFVAAVPTSDGSTAAQPDPATQSFPVLYVSSNSMDSPLVGGAAARSGSSSRAPTLVGGIVGGVLLVAIMAVSIVLVVLSRSRWRWLRWCFQRGCRLDLEQGAVGTSSDDMTIYRGSLDLEPGGKVGNGVPFLLGGKGGSGVHLGKARRNSDSKASLPQVVASPYADVCKRYISSGEVTSDNNTSEDCGDSGDQGATVAAAAVAVQQGGLQGGSPGEVDSAVLLPVISPSCKVADGCRLERMAASVSALCASERGRMDADVSSLQTRPQLQQEHLKHGSSSCGNSGNGECGGLTSDHVVVAPFTPLRPDLQLWEDPRQKVTLLPVMCGKGSYGKVCEGLYGGERVAVKLVRDVFAENSSHGASDKVLTTFVQEMQVMGRCQHPNVVRLLAACMEPPRFCLVMELMETSLQRMVFDGRPACRLLPLHKVLHIGCEIARALEYLHPTIVHRDLKPDNVLISNLSAREPVVKVSDFGLSRLRCTVSPTLHPEAGTPSYMAPECFDLSISSITHHVDIYSWAVVMWTMLTGIEPWSGLGVVEIAYRVTLLDQRLQLDDCVASGRCPPRLQRLLTHCWSRVPELRPAAAEVVKEMMITMQRHERSLGGMSSALNYMGYPGSVLSRIREYQTATTSATIKIEHSDTGGPIASVTIMPAPPTSPVVALPPSYGADVISVAVNRDLHITPSQGEAAAATAAITLPRAPHLDCGSEISISLSSSGSLTTIPITAAAAIMAAEVPVIYATAAETTSSSSSSSSEVVEADDLGAAAFACAAASIAHGAVAAVQGQQLNAAFVHGLNGVLVSEGCGFQASEPGDIVHCGASSPNASSEGTRWFSMEFACGEVLRSAAV